MIPKIDLIKLNNFYNFFETNNETIFND